MHNNIRHFTHSWNSVNILVSPSLGYVLPQADCVTECNVGSPVCWDLGTRSFGETMYTSLLIKGLNLHPVLLHFVHNNPRPSLFCGNRQHKLPIVL